MKHYLINNRLMFKRLAAFIYDSIIAVACLIIGTAILLPFHHGMAIAPNNHWYQIYLITLLFFYWGGFWYWGGQTVGMKAWHIRLTTNQTASLHFIQIIVRFVLALILPFISFFWGFFHPKKQTLLDIVTKTLIEETK